MVETSSDSSESMITSIFGAGKEEIQKTYSAKISRNELKQKPSAQISYKGNPNKLDSYLRDSLEDLTYDVKYHKLDSAKSGSFGEQVLDLSLGVTGMRLVRMKGSVSAGKHKAFLFLAGLGLLLLLIDYAFNNNALLVLGIVFLIAGGLLYYFSPVIRKYGYKPGFVQMWIVGDGTAYIGTKARKMHDAGSQSARSEHVVQTAYLEGDVNLIMGYETEISDEEYDAYLLKEGEKPQYPLASLLVATFQQKKEVSIGDKAKYEKLPEGKATLEKMAESDLRELRTKIQKFSGTH